MKEVKSMSQIDYEQDRVQSVTQADAAESLSSKVIELKNLEDEIANAEKSVSKLKEQAKVLSQFEIPEMMEKMHITKLKLKDGESVEIKKFYSKSLENLSQIEKNPIARNYYLSEAYELSGKITPSLEYSISAEQAKNIPLTTFFDAMGPRLDPIKAKGKNIKVGFNITDSNETFGVVIRNQIAEISNFYNDDYDVIVSVDSNTWKGIILKSESAARAIASGKLRIDGESIKFLQFSALFVND